MRIKEATLFFISSKSKIEKLTIFREMVTNFTSIVHFVPVDFLAAKQQLYFYNLTHSLTHSLTVL